MTQFATERALWDITSGPHMIQAYLGDPDTFLSRYAMTDAEKTMVKEKSVKALADLGHSQMLLMMFWNATSGGFASLPEYLGRLNAPAA